MSCSSPNPPDYCAVASPELKLYQAFVFSVPIFFTFILLLFFYLIYLRRHRANWQSLRMRANGLIRGDATRGSEAGLKKEVREMLPVVVFKESFLIRETQCSVCLADYQSDERLQRIPPCGHTFHVDCIDHWLSTHSTCPLCRVSLLPTPKAADANPVVVEVQPVDEEQSSQQHTEGIANLSISHHECQTAEEGTENANQDHIYSRMEGGEVRHEAESSVQVNVDSRLDSEGSQSLSCRESKQAR